jgi:3-oxoacyl-[acyl-carrier-protein] synthase III
MNKRVGLETIVREMPETVVTAKEKEYLRPVIPDFLLDVLRYPDEVRRFSHNDAAEILAESVAKKALDKAGLKPSDIDAIIANNCGGKYASPMVGPYVHEKLGFPKEVPVFNISNACASFVDACEAAWNFVLGGRYQRVLIVAVTALDTSGGGGRTDFTNPWLGVMGDGSAAGIVSSQNLKCEFLSYYGRTEGACYDFCGTDIRGPANPGLKGAPEQPPISSYLFLAPEYTQWWQAGGERFGVDGIEGALKKTNLALSDIDLVLFHQPADLIFDVWIDGGVKAGLSRDKWKHTWDKYGNLASCSIPVNLAEFWEEGIFHENMIQAWISVGAGGHIPTMIAKWLV